MTTDQEITESMPWYDKCELVKDFSYAGVAVFLDAFPVTKGHLVLVPVNNERENIAYCWHRAWLIGTEKVAAREWHAFNIGLNYGKDAGQTVDWLHIHLIPRMKGDCKDPTGGIRGVIPRLQNWRKAAKYKAARKKLGFD